MRTPLWIRRQSRQQSFRLPIWIRLPVYATAGAVSGLVAGVVGPWIGAGVGALVTLIIGILDYRDAARERERIEELERLAVEAERFQEGFAAAGAMNDRSILR